ncbi:MAG: TlpA disulfide reductase family protein [Bdellovibrionota bacterium]
MFNHRINSRFLGILLVLFFISGISSSCSSSKKIDPNSPVIVPRYTKFITLSGNQKSFEDLRGKKTVVIFWAQWCRYSRPVIKAIDEIAKQHKSRVNFLAISLDKEADFEVLKEEIKIREINNLTHAFSGAEYYDEAFLVLGGDTLPIVYVLDRNGRVIGIGDDEEVVKELITKLNYI